MIRVGAWLVTGLAVLLTACGPATSGSTAAAGTVSVGTAAPSFITSLPPYFTPLPTVVPPTLTPIAPLGGGLGQTELKYRVLEQFPHFFFCDPDYYPVARADELDLARQRFPELQANVEEFDAILGHNNLAGLTGFTDEQKLLVYREHKKLAAVGFELTTTGYQFQLQVAQGEGSGELVSGLIDGQGVTTILQRNPSIATCPICLAAGTLIDTPAGPIPVESLRVGTWIWTMDRAGMRVALPLIRLGKTVVPATHRVVHLVLSDGREVRLSPGHPTADGRAAGRLSAGESLDGAIILSVERVTYTGAATYDILPAGGTGFYWANGIPLASTLTDDGSIR